jgi:hypothetical protein
MPADAAELYRSGLSVCQIAEQTGLTRSGVEDKIRKGGLRGLCWCPVHRQLEVLN